MRKNPERLAWVVLLTSFFICIGLTVAVPLGVRAFILFSQVGQNVSLEVERGPMRVTWAGRGEPIAIAEKRDDIPERTIVTTDLTDQNYTTEVVVPLTYPSDSATVCRLPSIGVDLNLSVYVC